MIRAATPDDIEALVEIGRAMATESPQFSRMPYSPSKVRAMLVSLIGNPRGFVRVADDGGQIVGVMLGACTEHWACDGLVAFDLALYVPTNRRGGIHAARLLRAFSDWSRELGAHIATAGISTGINPEQADRLYLGLGFKRLGSVFDLSGR